MEKFFTRKEASQELMEKAKKHAPDVEVEEDFGEGYFAQYQRALWDLFEKPQSSLAAKVVSIVSVSTVLISTMGMCFNTFEWMQIKGRIFQLNQLVKSVSVITRYRRGALRQPEAGPGGGLLHLLLHHRVPLQVRRVSR